MKITLEVPDGMLAAEQAVKDLDGLRVFISSICPEHKIAVIVAYAGDGLDVGCTLAKLQGTAGKILYAANEPANEN